jgi:hypothetical protein
MDDRHSCKMTKLKRKEKNPVPHHRAILTGKKKTKLVRIRTSHRMQVGHAPCHCHSCNFMPKLLPANKACATSVALLLHQNHAQQTTAKTRTSAIATLEGAGNSAFKSNSTNTSSCCKLCEEFCIFFWVEVVLCKN